MIRVKWDDHIWNSAKGEEIKVNAGVGDIIAVISINDEPDAIIRTTDNKLIHMPTKWLTATPYFEEKVETERNKGPYNRKEKLD